MLVYNVSASMPRGLYFVRPSMPRLGDIAVIRLPPAPSDLAQARGYLPTHAFLLKPVVAVGGNLVCRFHSILTIDGTPLAIAAASDTKGRPLPQWKGCRRLRTGEVFALSSAAGSFDSRYFGVIANEHVVGTALAVWTNTR